MHAKRGRDTLATIGLLAAFRVTLIHDHGSTYAAYTCRYTFCNVHHLRELIAVAETYPRLSWPKQLVALLCEANEAACMARAAGLKALPGPRIDDFFTRYEALLAEAARHTTPAAPAPQVVGDASNRPPPTT